MKYKFIIIGLALSVLLFPNLTVAAQYHNEEALHYVPSLCGSNHRTIQ
jgi:hypothetical protein